METEQPIPQEAMAPHSPPEAERRALELPETRKQVDLGTYNPKPEALVNNWELLGHLPTPPTEDFKIDLIKSLGETDEAITAKAKEAIKKRDAPANPDATDFKKIGNIFTLRKLMLGHDWRAENVAGLAHEHITKKIEKTKHDMEGLKKLMPEQIILATIDQLEKKLADFENYKNTLEALINGGYPELWKKINPNETAPSAPEVDGRSPEEKSIDNLFPNEIPPVEDGATITTEDEQKETETKRLLALKMAIEKILPEQYKKLTPEITKVLDECGFSFIQRDNRLIKHGQTQDTTRYSLFFDPSRQGLPEQIAELQSAAYEEVAKYLKKIVERIGQAADTPSPVKRALFGLFAKGSWDYADTQDAEAILKQLHGQNPEKAYVMYMKESPTGEKLARINAGTDDEVRYKANTNDKKAPQYKDSDVTQFFSSPTFSFDINK